jgi:phosphoribosylglycinamide formyltransferase-1
MSVSPCARIAVLASGNGSNLQALMDAAAGNALQAEIALVVSHNAGAGALERARVGGIPAVTLSLTDRRDQTARAGLENQLLDLLEQYRIDLVVLAGWMLMLSPHFLSRCHRPVINVHPALLPVKDALWEGEIPVLRGAHTVRQALALHLPYTGVSVHHVVAEVDAGPVVAQEVVPVLPGDTEISLHDRIKQVEHRLLPMALATVLKSSHIGVFNA